MICEIFRGLIFHILQKKIRHPTQRSDYRPISILCALSKVLEKLVYKQLRDHITDLNLMDIYQTSFCEGNSIQTALWKILGDARLVCGQWKITLLVLFDFSWTFDTVNHTLLIDKLHSFHLFNQVIRWFISYLSDQSDCQGKWWKAVIVVFGGCGCIASRGRICCRPLFAPLTRES